jgi:DNA-binding NarL/FixJ family response regulator
MGIAFPVVMMGNNNELLDRPQSIWGTAETGGPPQCPVRFWIVDDKQEVRSLIAEALSHERGVFCDREFNSAEALLEALGRDLPPDVILTDVHMGGMTGVDALRFIPMLAPSVRVLVMTTFHDSIQETEALRQGASAFLLKSCGPAEIARSIQLAQLDSGIGERVAAARRELECAGNCGDPADAKPASRRERPTGFFRALAGLLRARPSVAAE